SKWAAAADHSLQRVDPLSGVIRKGDVGRSASGVRQAVVGRLPRAAIRLFLTATEGPPPTWAIRSGPRREHLPIWQAQAGKTAADPAARIHPDPALVREHHLLVWEVAADDCA